jgi:DNA-binding XRE family transcriptional regulator
MEKSKLSGWLKRARMAKGLSQIELAKELGLTNQTLMNIETGKHTPSIKSMKKIANYFNMTLSELYKMLWDDEQ